MREWLITGSFAFVVLLAFFICVGMGWPGTPDSCIPKGDLQKAHSPKNTCYCEPFNVQDVVNHVPGVRQPFNTFSNLYVLGTGAFLVFVAWKQRRKREDSRIPTTDVNRFRMGDVYPIFYIQMVVFLGLGSMWFHASIISWGGMFDQMSMYSLVSFLLSYSLIRIFAPPTYVFFILYPMVLLTYFALAFIDASSVLVIGISMVPYGIMEIIIWVQDWILDSKARGVTGSLFENFAKFKAYMGSLWEYWHYWIIGLALFIIAIIIRGRSDTGGVLCIDCSSAFQYHGVWHWLSGIMAVMLYFHWRDAKKR